MERNANTPSSKQQIRQLLRDAICLLCRNAVAHNIQMKIEALIGITIDNDDDVVLVNINELLEKSSDSIKAANDSLGAESHSYANNPTCQNEANIYIISDPGERCQEQVRNDNSTTLAYQEQSMTLMQCTPKVKSATSWAVVKASNECTDSRNQLADYTQNYNDYYSPSTNQEARSVSSGRSQMDYQNPDFPGQFLSSNGQLIDIKDETDDNWGPSYEDGLEVNQFDAQYGNTNDYTNEYEQCGDTMQSDQSMQFYSAPQMSIGVGRKKLNAARLVTRRTPKKSVTSSVGEEGQQVDEVSHVTIFTCSICGAVLTNRKSFVRHKQSHKGIVYRCDACGKILSRSDKLVAHRRICPASQYQQNLDDQYGILDNKSYSGSQ